ncbi:MAG: hypothetical protein QXL02_00460 [Candidatus Anstonellales archaeon]
MKRFISEQTDNEKLLNVIDRIRKGEDVKLKVVKKGNSDIYELVEITPENNYIPILTLNYSGNDENKKKNHPIILVLLIAILKKR